MVNSRGFSNHNIAQKRAKHKPQKRSNKTKSKAKQISKDTNWKLKNDVKPPKPKKEKPRKPLPKYHLKTPEGEKIILYNDYNLAELFDAWDRDALKTMKAIKLAAKPIKRKLAKVATGIVGLTTLYAFAAGGSVDTQLDKAAQFGADLYKATSDTLDLDFKDKKSDKDTATLEDVVKTPSRHSNSRQSNPPTHNITQQPENSYTYDDKEYVGAKDMVTSENDVVRNVSITSSITNTLLKKDKNKIGDILHQVNYDYTPENRNSVELSADPELPEMPCKIKIEFSAENEYGTSNITTEPYTHIPADETAPEGHALLSQEDTKLILNITAEDQETGIKEFRATVYSNSKGQEQFELEINGSDEEGFEVLLEDLLELDLTKYENDDILNIEVTAKNLANRTGNIYSNSVKVSDYVANGGNDNNGGGNGESVVTVGGFGISYADLGQAIVGTVTGIGAVLAAYRRWQNTYEKVAQRLGAVPGFYHQFDGHDIILTPKQDTIEAIWQELPDPMIFDLASQIPMRIHYIRDEHDDMYESKDDKDSLRLMMDGVYKWVKLKRDEIPTNKSKLNKLLTTHYTSLIAKAKKEMHTQTFTEPFGYTASEHQLTNIPEPDFYSEEDANYYNNNQNNNHQNNNFYNY